MIVKVRHRVAAPNDSGIYDGVTSSYFSKALMKRVKLKSTSYLVFKCVESPIIRVNEDLRTRIIFIRKNTFEPPKAFFGGIQNDLADGHVTLAGENCS
ncbi:MAG: hypothetical protein AB7J46_01260 [Candidatus Altimarinota bacterium]